MAVIPLRHKIARKLKQHKHYAKKLIIVLGVAMVLEIAHIFWENGFNMSLALHGTMILGHMVDAAIESIPDYIDET